MNIDYAEELVKGKWRAALYLYTRGANRERKIFRRTDFSPFLYVPTSAVSLPQGAEVVTDLFGRDVVKYITKLPKHVKMIRKNYDFTDEADVLYPKRYLISKGILCGIDFDGVDLYPADTLGVPPRILYGDIEVKSPPEIMPRHNNPIWPIVSFQFADNYTRKVTLFLLGENYHPEIYTIKHNRGEEDVFPEIRAFTDESMMLTAVENFITREIDPDVITFYNGDNFDFPYWFNRLEQFDMKPHPISPLGKAWNRMNNAIGRLETKIASL